MNIFNQPPGLQAFEYQVTAAQFAETVGRLVVPPMTLGREPEALAHDTLAYFHQLWHANGYSPIRSPHHAVITVPPTESASGIVLVNSYRGLTDGQVLDRQPYLEEYRTRSQELRDIQDKRRRRHYQEKLQAIIARHLPDLGGLQGIEQYQVHLVPPDTVLPFRYRLTSRCALSVTQDYRLQAEASQYDLPTRAVGIPWNIYPHSPQHKPQLSLDDRRGGNEEARPTRKRLLALGPILRQRLLATGL